MDTNHNLTYWWSLLLGFFSLLSLQDYVFILGAIVSAYFTIKTYYAKRRDERAKLAEERRRTEAMVDEERRRTDLLKEFLNAKNGGTPPAALEIAMHALERMHNDGKP